MSGHDTMYIEEFQPKLPKDGDIVNLTWVWNGQVGACDALKHLIKTISEGNLREISANTYTGRPFVGVDVTSPKQQQRAYLDEEGRPEIIEGVI